MAKTGADFARLALRFLGTPYRWGGSSPSGFDCSGLVQYALGQLGISAPRTSQAQYAWGRPVPPSALKPGDLVFLNFPGESSPGHVMIWLGGGKVLQAPSSGKRVQVSSFDPKAPGSNEWGATVVGYRRVPGLSYAHEPDSIAGGGASSSSSDGGGGGGVASHIPVIGGAISGAEATGHLFGKLLDPRFWLRALEVVGGFTLVLLGLYLLSRQLGLAEPPMPDALPVGAARGLSDEAAAELQFSPGRAAEKGPRRKAPVRHEVSEAAERRAKVRGLSERAEPSDEIPF